MTSQPFDPVRFKLGERQAWNASAAGWSRWWPTFDRAGRPVAERLVAMAHIGPGHRVLDVATGIGEPAVTAARKVGPTGRVLAVDQAPEMLAVGRERAAALKLANLEFREADAETLAIEERDFDAVLCRWGLMFLPDLERALKRVYQLLKREGWFATAVWGPAAEVPIIGLAAEQVRALAEMPPAPPDNLGPLRFADPSVLTRALEDAGFRNLATERVVASFEFDSADGFVRFREEVSHAFRAMLAAKPPELQDRIRAAIRDAARRYATRDGTVRMANQAVCIAAQK